MGVRSTVARGLIRAAKAFGGAEPPGMAEAARDVSQMGMDHPFAPGEPIGPYDGYSRYPRVQDFTTGYNIATRPRTHERVSFETLTGLINAYDVAQACLWHRIDSLRSVKWKLIAAENYSGDVADAIAAGTTVMRKPDRKHHFKTWFAKWMYDVLAYDAGTLYRLRNRAGRCTGLLPVDGRTVAPLLDYWGNSPDAPAEAYVQYVNGLPWNWLTRDDLIYEPYRPHNDSPYGHAPIEAVILNANTDLRTQIHFLMRFTEGNIPEAFASAPETWSPDQIEQFQGYWDSIMYGDQSRKHQVRWMPGGSAIAWTNEKDFSDVFSLHMMRKTCAVFHVVPTDLGFTENSNYSTGESQADVQHRVGDLPLMEFTEDIFTHFLYDDLGLPLQFQWDRGEDQDDRLVQAQADQYYIDRAVVSASEIREMRFGLPEPQGQIIPRVFFTNRAGPIPLNALLGVAGKIDPQTGAPEPGTALPREAFTTVPGVLPNPPMVETPLAVREFGPKALPPAPEKQPEGTPEATDPAHVVAKDAAPAEGITSGTGIYSYDGPGHRDDADDEDEPGRETVAKAELAAFRRFRQARIRQRAWRDFEFAAVGPVRAHRLNDAGRLAVRKAAGEVAVAGLAVLAADTGRVLMLQRSLDPDDPAAGKLEFPGGHIEGDESPLAAAWREWAEETGAVPAPGLQTGTWTAGDGVYQGIVWTIESESLVPVRGGAVVPNPDADPDGDGAEAILWMSPADLPGNAAVRPELLASIGDVIAALGCQQECCGAACCAGACCGGAGGCPCGATDCGTVVAKAGEPAPKPPAPQGAQQQNQPPVQQAWPGWDHDLDAIAYWVPLLIAALLAGLSVRKLVKAWLGFGAASPAPTRPERIRDLTAQAQGWLDDNGPDFATAAGDVLEGVITDGYAIGAASADAAVEAFTSGAHLGSIAADMGDWAPGASRVARELAGNLGAGDGLADLLSRSGVTIQSIADTRLADLAKVLADGAERGLSAGDLADAVRGMLSDPSRAEMIVATELARAAHSAAFWSYRLHGIEQVMLVTAEDDRVCVICDAEAAKGAQPLNSAPTLPLHPLDRCALVPA